ncbi:MAG: inactive transglutaminase family protein [Acidiferrobacterales bacterium]|nr:inactive transglutaminase family protein [Acidiferrobacterales bacterium]
MPARAPFFFLILALIVLGLSSIYYRHVEIGVPLSSGERITIWQIEAEISFDGNNEPVEAELTLPNDGRFELVEEFTASPAYGVHLLRDQIVPKVVWSKRLVEPGRQTLYYRGSYKESQQTRLDPPPEAPPEFEAWEEPYQSSAQTVLNAAYQRSGNTELLLLQIKEMLFSEDQNVALLLSRYNRTSTFIHLLDMAGVSSKRVGGLLLEDARRNQTLVPLVKVYLDDEWQIYNLNRSALDPELPLLIWRQDAPALLDVVGGLDSRISFSISRERRSALQEAKESVINSEVTAFSAGLYNLPLAEQNLFKGILLLPIGALVVVFLRIMIGIKCSGTFMPILIATSFIQTELIPGVLGFLAIVSVGLLIRSYLSHLNLLLVSRISAVVIVVIGIIILFTIVAYRMGLTEVLTISFFPMIIMAWTIERMSILWEEEGAREVLVQGLGSLLVAVIAYLMMDNQLIRHWAFNFLGVHALIMAAILMMGQYTGYRLLELRRFAPLVTEQTQEK